MEQEEVTQQPAEEARGDEEILELIGTTPPEGALFITQTEDGEIVLTSVEPE